jgi:hypothetical protein
MYVSRGFLKEALFSQFNQCLCKIRTETTFCGCSQASIGRHPKAPHHGMQLTELAQLGAGARVVHFKLINILQILNNSRRHKNFLKSNMVISCVSQFSVTVTKYLKESS